MRDHREITPSMKKLTSNCQRSNQLAFISKREERFSIYICLLINFNHWQYVMNWQVTINHVQRDTADFFVRPYLCLYLHLPGDMTVMVYTPRIACCFFLSFL